MKQLIFSFGCLLNAVAASLSAVNDKTALTVVFGCLAVVAMLAMLVATVEEKSDALLAKLDEKKEGEE